MAYNNQLSMRKIICTSFLLLFSLFISAQEGNDKISLQITDASLQTAIESLESKTNFRFYFDSKWIASDTIKITKNYQTPKLSYSQTPKLSNYHTPKLSNYQTIKLPNYQTTKLPNY